jgi:deoxycytidine triphosphate deaminase
MEPVSGREAAERLTGMVSAKYQVHGYAVNLTVRQIYSIDPTGQVDFGGTEYIAAQRSPVASLRRRSDDKYDWWDLSRGCYALEFNEGLHLADNEIAILEPDERLLRSGAMHNTSFLRGQGERMETLLIVGSMSVLIKQNARVSRLRVFRFGPPPPAAASPAPGAAGKKAKKATRRKGSRR